MKYGVRKPNIKKSVAARTTGKVNRQIKKATNPLYGKKGMGIVNDPKRAAYNAMYNQTTIGATDILSSESDGSDSETSFSLTGIFAGIGSFFQLLFALIQLAFWIACVIGIIALIVFIIRL